MELAQLSRCSKNKSKFTRIEKILNMSQMNNCLLSTEGRLFSVQGIAEASFTRPEKN